MIEASPVGTLLADQLSAASRESGVVDRNFKEDLARLPR